MKVSDYIAQFLYRQGVRHVFEVIGGMTTHLVDSLCQQGKIQVISVHHEQAAAFAAEGNARITGVPGVALATSGPGATNLLTGIGSCYFDSVPAVFITGQVNRNEQKQERPIRQLGFQETDIVPMAVPITKAAWKVETVEELPALLSRAFSLALEGRPGPVLLDIPMDIQRADIDENAINTEPEQSNVNTSYQQMDLAELFTSLENAKRPIILLGGGIRSANLRRETLLFLDRLNVPVVHSLMGTDILPYTHPNRVGMIGTYGNRWANLAIAKADVLLVLGSRLDVRQTGSDVAAFQEGKTIWHIDCEPGEINNRLSGCHAIVSDLEPFLKAVNAFLTDHSFSNQGNLSWEREIAELRQVWPDTGELTGISGIHPNRFIQMLSDKAQNIAAFSIDVGQHQMWAAQSIRLLPHQRFITSGGMGAMGFSLPAAVGAAFANAGKTVAVIAGDGGFQMNIQELQTIAHHQLPIKMVVMNNRSQGMVRQFQQSYFDSRFDGTVSGYSAPDFAQVASAYGIKAMTIENEGEIETALQEMLEQLGEPYLLNVLIGQAVNVYPKIAFGKPLTEMEPYLAQSANL